MYHINFLFEVCYNGSVDKKKYSHKIFYTCVVSFANFNLFDKEKKLDKLALMRYEWA